MALNETQRRLRQGRQELDVVNQYNSVNPENNKNSWTIFLQSSCLSSCARFGSVCSRLCSAERDETISAETAETALCQHHSPLSALSHKSAAAYHALTWRNIARATCRANTRGTPMVNFLCIVLWCHTFMPIHAPTEPPMAAIASRVASDMRHFPLLALYLSIPNKQKEITLTARR